MEKDKGKKIGEEVKEEEKPVRLGQVASAHEIVYMTPEGNLSHEEYLVWIGNEIVALKEALVGK